MSGPYFESGYIDANYFEGDGVTQSANATLTLAASVTVSGSITRQGDSTLTVNATHSTEIQRNRFAEVSITDAFNATVSVSISKNLFSTLNSQFDWSVTASKIASNQSTLDAIIALSLQGDRQRNLVSTTLSSSFTLTTQIERIQTAQSTQNTAFTVTAQIDKILNAQSDQSSAFTLTTNTTKILNAQSDQSSAVTVTAQIDKILNAQGSVTVTSTITATVSKIISGNVNLTDAFTSTFTVVVTKNHTADLNSAFSISVQAIKTGSNTISLNSEFNTTTTANRTRSTTVTITAEITHSTQSNRIRLFAVTVSSDVNVAVTIDKIVQASATINSAFEPTLTVTVFRNHTASLNAEFTIQITAQKFGNNNIDLTSAFGITAGVDRIRLFTIAIESNHSLNGVISLIKQGNFEQSATFTVQASTGTIKQSQCDLSGVFNAQLTVIAFRNHTAALASVTEISAVGTVTRSAVMSSTSTTTVNATVAILSGVIVEMNVSISQNIQVNRTASAQANIQDAFVSTMTVNTVLGITVNLTSTTEFTVLGTRVRLLNQGIGAESTLVTQVDRIISVTANLQSTVTTTGTVDRIRSVTAQFTDVFTAQMSITVSVNLVATLNTAFAFTAIPNRLLNSSAAIQGAFSISTAINGRFAITAAITAQSTVAATVGLRKTAQSNIQARFSRVLNQGVTRSVTIIDTETPNEEYGAVGSALARFDGNDVLTISNMPIIGTGDYTIEMLAHRSAEMGDGSTFIEQDLFNAEFSIVEFGVPRSGPYIYIGNDDEIKAGNTYILNGDQITTGAFKFQTDANLHIALVRRNAQTRLYVNGVQRGDTLADTVPWTSTEWFLGDLFLGYVDEFRVSNTARYTANFTNPYADLTQDTPFVPDANTIIYLSFDTVIDEPICSVSVRKTTSANLQSQMSRIVTEGGVTVSAVNKFGGNSVQFDGVNDRITILNQPALSTGDFTIEMFFRRSLEQNDSTLMTLMQMYDDADSTISDELSININTNEQVQYLVRGDVKLVSNRIFDITDWHRVTVVRRNNVTKMWLDNQFTGDSFFDNNPINSNQVYVGNNQDLTAPYRGYVDDLQINRYSRYTTQHSTNSALPDQPYQFVGDGSSVMLHFNNAQIDLPLVEVSTVIRPTTVSISGVFTPSITINTEINVAITLSSATTFTCAVSVIKPGTAAHTAQSQLVVVFTKIRNIQFVGAVQSSITATGDLVKLFVGTAQSISSVNVIAVSTKNIQSNINTATTLNTTVNQTAGAVINIAVTVSTQATATRIQTAISNITVNGAVNVTITRIHPGVAAITVNHTVSAQAQKTVNSVAAITAIATQTVLVGEIVQFGCAIQTEAATLTVAVRTGNFFVNMDSAFGLIANVRRIRSSSAQFNSAIEFAVTDFRFKQFETQLNIASTQSTTVSRTRPATVNVQTETNISITILRIKSSSTAIAVSTTHTVTARKTGSGAAILVGTFTITAQPQPLNQILTVVRATMVGQLTATVRKVFLEEYEYRIREEVRTLNIVEEQRDYLIVEEQRTLTIQGAE